MMRLRARAVGLAALVGFVAITAWSAEFVPPSCCPPTCDPCPVLVCSPAAVAAPSRVELARVAEAVGPLALPLATALAPASLFASFPSFAPHAFQRPMRN